MTSNDKRDAAATYTRVVPGGDVGGGLEPAVVVGGGEAGGGEVGGGLELAVVVGGGEAGGWEVDGGEVVGLL
jgi:hypothetical protein